MRRFALVAKVTLVWRQWWLGLVLLLVLLAGCGEQRMVEQAKYEVFEPSTFFEDGRSARDLVPNTVARGRARLDTHLYEGTVNDAPATIYPFPITQAVLARGQERYDIFCSPCHGYDGYGDGIVVQRGLSPPPSFHEERLRQVPPGYIFAVITNGIGVMYSYDYRVAPEDRWAIIAYIQALQLSQNATVEDVPAAERAPLQTATE
ncbi:MAG: cytochrome c [Caldilineaceae bacterium]